MRLRKLLAVAAAAALPSLGVTPLPAFAATTGIGDLVSNPSFEQLTDSGQPACWYATGTLTHPTLRTTSRAHYGTHAGRISGSTGSLGTMALLSGQDPTCAIPVTGGNRYALSLWYEASAPASIEVRLRGAAGIWYRWMNGSPLPPTTTWLRAGFTTQPLPVGTTALSYGLRIPATASLTLDDANALAAGAPGGSITSPGTVLFQPTFPTPDRLVTNSYSFWNPTHADASVSADWQMTSGSLFARNGNGYSGFIDGIVPDPLSILHTESAIFRLNTARFDFGNVRVDFSYLIDRLGSTLLTPPVAWDGLHIWMRYQTEFNLYSAYVARRDGRVMLKKKCPGGLANGGTYVELSDEYPGFPIRFGSWTSVGASVVNNTDGTVTLRLYENGRLAVTAVDHGQGCRAITAPGAVGIRGDNAEFNFKGFTVTAQ
ncbi:MAG TPA: hypothetical protein VJT31_05450 [Rugosimonospora sp.]|nr:hypothetical protein [Rugosimonospora sp.]